MEYKVRERIDDDVIESVYKSRGIDDDIIDEILYAGYENYENVLNYKNIDRAYEKLMETITKGNKISILVDPDVDGYVSASIMYVFLYDYLVYNNVHYIIQEEEENSKSHGITKEVLDKVINDGTKLLITPDAGSSDIEQQKKLYENNIDFIALDHHEFEPNEVPDYSIVVNNQDGQVKNKNGSGSLVTYKFIKYVAEKEGISIGNDFLSLVNIANIGDMMNMRNLENRYFYNKGKLLENTTSTLLRAFARDLKRDEFISIENVSYGITNRMNAVIRIGTNEQKRDLFEALLDSDRKVEYKYQGKTRTQSIQAAMVRISGNVKKQQKKLVETAMKNFKVLNSWDDKILLVDGKDMHRGVRGLVANKIMGEVKKSVLVLKLKDGLYSGSARGCKVNSFKDICKESGLFEWLRGHKNACGFCIKEENLSKFIDYMNNYLKDIEFDSIKEIDFVYDGNIPLADLVDIGELEELWCKDIESPKLIVKNVIINSEDIKKNKATISFKIDKIQYRKEFCKKEFYEKLICLEDNLQINKDLRLTLLCEVKKFNFNNLCYMNIIDAESEVI